MARLTAKDTFIRERWKAFLDPLVGHDGGRVTVTALAQRVVELTDLQEGGDIRGEVHAYRNGAQTVGPRRAYFCGEALRASGVRWCSGLVALYAAGRFGDYVHGIARLALLRDMRKEIVPRLAVYVPIAASTAGHYSVPATINAKRCLEKLSNKIDGRRMEWAVDRVGQHFEHQLEGVIVTAESSGDFEFLERLVAASLSEWALSIAEPETAKEIALVMLALQSARVSRILNNAQQVRNITEAIMDGIKLNPKGGQNSK